VSKQPWMHVDPRQLPTDLKEPAMDAGYPPDRNANENSPRCRRNCPDGECYCSEPSYGDQAYTGICPGCGGYEECYCEEE
jgi:hypothetical protein